jgi:gamma-aminobutyric acid type B receptor
LVNGCLSQGIITEYCVYICQSTPRYIFLGVLYGYKMVLQVIALVLAFSIRKVKIKGLDDAKFIGASIYVTSIVLAVTIVGTYTLDDVINAFAGLVCSGFFIGTTVILIFVFVPVVSTVSAGV